MSTLKQNNRAAKKRNPGPVHRARAERRITRCTAEFNRQVHWQHHYEVPGRLLAASKVRAR